MKRADDLAGVYREAPVTEKRSIIKSVVAKIELGRGQMTIEIDRAAPLDREEWLVQVAVAAASRSSAFP